MKHLWKRVLAMLLAATMVFSMVSCGSKDDNKGNNPTSAPGESSTNNGGDSAEGNKKEDRGEPIELTVYSQLANFSGEQVGWFAKVMLDKFNVKLMIIPDTDGVFDTRMESGHLGDIVIFGSNGSDYQRAVAADMLFDWEEDGILQEYGSYMVENMSTALETNRNLTPKKGKIYGIGHNVAANSENFEEFFYTWDLRWDLYKQLGYPVVKDLDDLVTLFKQMKEICPTDENGKVVKEAVKYVVKEKTAQ